MGFSMVLANVFAHQYGDATIAGNGVQMRVNSICIMLMVGMAQGYQPFAGYNYGAKNYHRLISGLKTTMLYNSALACFFTLLFVLFGGSFIRAFTDDRSMIWLISLYWRSCSREYSGPKFILALNEKNCLQICKLERIFSTFVRDRIVEELRGLEFFCFFMYNIRNRLEE